MTYAAYITLYTWINQLSAGRPSRTLFLPGEAHLRVIPAAAPVYAVGFLLPLLVMWTISDLASLRRLMTAFGLTVSAAFLTFLLFPVKLNRPAATAGESVLLRLAYVDGPYNDFPSLHVAIAWLVYFACRGIVRHPVVLLIAVVCISVSTILVKQHYVVDVVAGWLIASVAWRVSAHKPERAERLFGRPTVRSDRER